MLKVFYKLGVLGLMVTNAPLMFQKLHQFEWYGGTLRAWIKGLGLPQNSKVLELGSGSGALTANMLDMGYRVCAVDSSMAMIKRAGRLVGSRDGLTFTLADALNLPFEDTCFDAPVAASLLNVVSDKQALLTEMSRATKVGGTISAFFPSDDFTKEGADDFSRSNGLPNNQRAAIEVWASAARKLSEDEVVQAFERAGLIDVKATRYLDQMLVSVTGTRSA